MNILPSMNNSEEPSDEQSLVLGGGQRHAARFLHQKDPTGGLLATVMFMDSVEDWVISRLELDPDQREEVQARQARLSEILTQHRQKVPPDNHSLLQLFSWMKSSELFYTLDYLTQFQPEFTVQLVDHCKATCNDDVNATLLLQRIRVLYKTRLADRIYSPENFDYLMSVLVEGERDE
jgi:hypothetical protein